jgi:protein-tyrosine phosphatase
MLLRVKGRCVSKISVLFVCLGNICRSPLGQGIFEHKVAQRGLADKFIIDSCGTGSWHVGNEPHVGSIEVAKKYGISIENQRARDLQLPDFEKFGWILAMDSSNLKDIKKIADKNCCKDSLA